MEIEKTMDQLETYLEKRRGEVDKEVAELQSRQIGLYESLMQKEKEYKLKEFDILYNLKAQITLLEIQNESKEITINIFNRQQELIDEYSKITTFLNDLEHHLNDCLIKGQDKIIDKYQVGTKKKAEVSQQKWALAQQYFAEEIPNHKTLLSARKAAAEKAGIKVNERRLIQMLPVEK